ncbi:hypothetical protein BC828DRAFT_282176 [Blastocladiella britannica]|nr:hypothetical protein BC828DRAFT_282176 [Blastocladiella britannica]
MLPLVVLAQKSALAHVISPIHPLALRVVVRDVLLYHYYGGIVMASLKRYDEAIQLFEFTLTVPSRAVSAIQVAAYKKLVLVSAIARGSIPTIPKMGPSPVPGAVRAAAEIYHDLVRAMSATDGRLEATLANHALKFQADDNLGLARQAVTSAQIHALRRLTDVYVTVSLREAARALGTTGTIAGAERLLVRMIDSGAVIASITHDDSAPVAGSDDEGGMVHFQDDVCAYDGVDGVTDLVARISATLAASERARDIDYKLIAKAKKSTPRMADHEADYMGALGGSFLEDRMDLS